MVKKGLFGYNVSEIDVILDALKLENKSLNAKIDALTEKYEAAMGEKNEEIDRLKEEMAKLLKQSNR